MKMVRKISVFLLALMLCTGMMSVPVSAAESSQDGLKVTLTTDKEEYSQGEQIAAELTVTNSNTFEVTDISVRMSVPEGYSLADSGEAVRKIGSLAAGRSAAVKTVFTAGSSEESSGTSAETKEESSDASSGADEESGSTSSAKETEGLKQNGSSSGNSGSTSGSQGISDSQGTSGIQSASGADTGDSTNMIFWIMLLLLAIGGIAVLVVKSRNGKKMLALFLCLLCGGIGSVTLPAKAYALGASSKSISISTEVRIDGKKAAVEAVVEYTADTAEDAVEKDTDNDSLSDIMEELLGTDSSKADTDGDGLSDGVEFKIGTDPTLADSDGNGIGDGDEDSDGDGLTNLEELRLGTSPGEKDTDDDGISDTEELNRYKTDPLNMDTDGDGADDGWEIQHKYDPLKADGKFEVSESCSDGKVTAEADVQLAGKQISSLEVKEAEEPLLLADSIPGYIGSAFEFTVDGSFEQATISFTFDEKYLEDKSFKPLIYYFNEETQLLEAMKDTTVEGNRASLVVKHFSTYILLNQTEFDKVWDTEIKPPAENGEYTGMDVVITIDSSGSMAQNDPYNLRLAAAGNFVDKLGDNDRAAVIDFDQFVCTHTRFTSDHDKLKSLIDQIDRDGGTNIAKAMEVSIAQFTEEYDYDGYADEKNPYKCIIFLTDGDDNTETEDTKFTTLAAEKHIAVYTIGLGKEAKEERLKKIAEGTGGKYYFASSADTLDSIYDEVAGETIDYTTDSNGDGISDYFTKMLCEGTLKLGTGMNSPFYGLKYEDVQAGADYDGDGLDNGQELIVKYVEALDRVYVFLMSDPTSPDSDYDGIDDSEEISQDSAHNNRFEADMYHITGGNKYHYGAQFTVDYSLFFGDNTKFNQKLAQLASVYAIDMYEEKTIGDEECYGYLTLTEGASGTTKGNNGVALGEMFGLNDCVNFDETELCSTYAKKDSNGNPVDQSDVSEAFVGHRLVSYNGEQREIIVLAIRGTNGTQDEWSSNFDIGADTEDYYSMTGEHPDWVNKSNHKGFDVAANRILTACNRYIDSLELAGKIDKTAKRSIFITGHSRGAGIANILGAHFEKDPEYDSFVYTMASPYTTTAYDAESYETIFNIRNSDDLVTYLPLADWNFKKFGRTLNISVKDRYEDRNPFTNRDNTFEALFDRDYDSNGYVDDCEDAFAEMTKNRKTYYELDDSSGDGQVLEGMLHTSDEFYNDFEKMLTAGKMLPYCELETKDKLIGYELQVTYCAAYAAQNLANLAAANEIKVRTKYGVWDWINIDLKGKYSKARSTFVKASGELKIMGGMECPHTPDTYYLITTNTSYDDYEK
ncbi:MAG: VWA domain-containing protein [Lachnospiraceae bacterium]|nr:VWA domain-containing protein [Lachnospiraceae bacterium]